MIDKLISILTFASGLGCGLIGGSVLRFFGVRDESVRASFACPRYRRHASINIVVINPAFFAVFFGTAAGCIVLAVSSLSRWQRPGASYVLMGSLLYLVGTILVTMLFNVPRNNTLAAIDPTSSDGARLWTDYVVSWTAWNHVRTIAALAAAALLTIALCRQLTLARPR